MSRIRWHRVFHPLSGADPITLVRLIAHAGPPSARGALPFAVAFASSLVRLPFTLAELGWGAARPTPPAAPVFIVGYPRSGTTHLHNLMAASGQFATVPPVLAGMPWEARGLARVLRPFIDAYLPETRLIDAMRLGPDSPTEDEVALANMCGLSYFHAIYFPRRFGRDYVRGLTFENASPHLVAGRARALTRYVAAMGRRDGRPLLLKNPAYTAGLGWLRALYPAAKVVHIHRDPRAVFASNARALRVVLRELALQTVSDEEIEAAVLDAYPRVMERLVAEAALLPPGAFAEVSFERLAAGPLSALRDVWNRLSLPAPDAALAGIERYLATVEGYRPGTGDLNAAQRAAVEARWGPQAARAGQRPGREASSTSRRRSSP